MTYFERLQDVTIIGAAGKMGSGITLLTAMEMADVSLLPENKDKKFILNAVDLNKEALSGLIEYLRVQLIKISEKKILALKEMYPHLTEEAALKEQYVHDVLAIVNPVAEMSAARYSTMIFEAAVENPDIKVEIFKELEIINPSKPWYFTNTSSIPIHTLNQKAHLEGRIVGFHFYNPPAVQKLVELIGASETLPTLIEFAATYAKRLRKTLVFSNDIAAFIGNGHFTRDILHAVSEVELLSTAMSLPEAIYTMNKVSQDYLVRPMGIFQLCDYVGIDVCSKILKVMAAFIKDEDFTCHLLDQMMQVRVMGGQYADGSQKDGFFKYDKSKIIALYDYTQKAYVDLSEIKEFCDERLGVMPNSAVKWKDVISSPDKEALLKAHFQELKTMDTLGAQLAIHYGQKAVEIAVNLVKTGVANNKEDVNTVMMTGFFHAYGPVNDFFQILKEK